MGSQQPGTAAVDERLPENARELLEAAGQLMGLADAAMRVYAKTVVMTREEAAEAHRDFFAFHVIARHAGARGIRLNFNGCLHCPDDDRTPKRLRRILLTHRKILAATQGRALATTVCLDHEDRPDLVEAGLRRIVRDPPEVPTRPEPGFGVAA